MPNVDDVTYFQNLIPLTRIFPILLKLTKSSYTKIRHKESKNHLRHIYIYGHPFCNESCNH